MHREGHVGVALVVYAPFAAVVTLVAEAGAAVALGVVVASLCMVPDVDMKLPLVKHRGITHTVHFLVVVTVAFAAGGLVLGRLSDGAVDAVVLGTVSGLVAAIAVGSHLLADMLTPAGIDPWRTGDRVSYGIARAGNPIANYALLGLGVAAVGIAVIFAESIPI